MKEKIALLLKKNMSLSVEEISKLLEAPPSPELGDYSFPCFALSKEMQKSPNLIAIQLSQRIELPEEVEKIEAKGAYLNFFLNKKTLASSVIKKILSEKLNYGK
ncbi:MAG: arginine--tRNA ligase, partial [Nanoarchaeota archaeon]